MEKLLIVVFSFC